MAKNLVSFDSTHKRRSSTGSYVIEDTDDEFTALLSAPAKENNQCRHVSYGCISDTRDEYVSESQSENDALLSTTEDTVLCPEDIFKRKLKYFFMNPLDKWKTKGKIPWKLALQIIKIILVTVQLSVFRNDGFRYEQQKRDTISSFRHIFLEDWNSIQEIVSYPPAAGPYAVYTRQDFYVNLDHVIKRYSNITAIALGTFMYDNMNDTIAAALLCNSHYKKFVTSNSTVVFDGTIEEICVPISAYPEGDPRWRDFSIKDYLIQKNSTINFDSLIKVNLKFSLKTVYINAMGDTNYPECYIFKVTVTYDNSEHDGRMLISLDADSQRLKCNSIHDHAMYHQFSYIMKQVLNCFVILICSLSVVLCFRCLCKGYVLCKQTTKFFTQQFDKPMTFNEMLEFIDLWYLMMVVNDLLIITGSVLKICIEQRIAGDLYANCAIALGTGNVLVWAGVLRYLGFFRPYNDLILTVKKAIPNVLRFMLCAGLLFGGFCFCGWVVLGPYNIKFDTLSSTSECLFAMMNGDDLYATFAITSTNSLLMWWFSRIYLYVFISLYIYVVISIFISIIMGAYERVKDTSGHGSPQTRIQVLIADCSEDSCSSFYRQKRKKTLLFSNFLICCKQRNC